MDRTRTVTLKKMKRKEPIRRTLRRQKLQDLATIWMAFGGTIDRNSEVKRRREVCAKEIQRRK